MKPNFIFCLLLAISGCTEYAQIYKTHAQSNISVKDYSYFFENDTVKIEYTFWSEHGVLDFTVFNKLSVPLYVDWKKSALVRNSIKLDYFIDEETMVSSTAYNSYLFGKWNSWGTGKSNTVAVKSHPERISFIAPKSSIERNQFMLFPMGYTKFNGTDKKINDRTDSTKKILPKILFSISGTFLLFLHQKNLIGNSI